VRDKSSAVQNCSLDDVKAMQADLVMFETYGETDLNEDPCTFTGCGHIVTLSSMDGILDMPKHYDIDPMTPRLQITCRRDTRKDFVSPLTKHLHSPLGQLCSGFCS